MRRAVIILAVTALPFGVTAFESDTPATPPSIPGWPPYVLAEAEDFHIDAGDWRALQPGESYYFATLSNTFISRQRVLSAPEQCANAVASLIVTVPAAGKYRVWTCYECPSHFRMEHTLRVEQGGKALLERKFGATENPKLWPFGKGLVPMAVYEWGSGDNIVWEPAPEPIDLTARPAKLTLLAGPQPNADDRAAKRNIDCVLLTADLDLGIKDAEKQTWHVLDRYLNQNGECFLRISNAAGQLSPVAVTIAVKAHNPYWQPRGPLAPDICRTGAIKPAKPEDWIAPGQASPWVAIGQALDTTNMQELVLTVSQPAVAGLAALLEKQITVEFSRDPAGTQILCSILWIPAKTGPTMVIEMPHDLRGPNPVIRTVEEWHEDLLGYLKSLPPTKGKPPERVPVFGIMGGKWHGKESKDGRFEHLRTETGLLLGRNVWHDGEVPADLRDRPNAALRKNLEIDVRGVPTPDLEKHLRDRKAKGELERVRFVSFGDEITVGGYKAGDAKDDAEFRVYLKQMKAPVDAAMAHLTTDPAGDKKFYYWSQMFSIDRGIAQLKERTAIVEKVLGPDVLTGANYSPHPHYWPHAGQWVRLFRQRAMTMPWAEDWTFQVPEVNMMMSAYLCDVLRCAGRDHNMPIQFYTMPHWPGQTPRDFTLSFYSALAHGNKAINLFAAVPIYDYTENWVAWEARDTWKAIRDCVHDVGLADDLIATGTVRPAKVAIVISHVNDIWEQARGSSIYNFERKNLYYLLRYSQIPVDFVTEEDVADGKVKEYRVLFHCGDHLLRRAADGLKQWVGNGGFLVSVAGGGLLDEYELPNDTLNDVFGIRSSKLTLTEKNCRAKEGLAWLKPLDQFKDPFVRRGGGLPVVAARQVLEPTSEERIFDEAYFSDTRAAESVGRKYRNGFGVLLSYFPGCAFMQPAIPRRPFDRGTTDENFNHFLPTQFNRDMTYRMYRLLAVALGDDGVNALSPFTIDRVINGKGRLLLVQHPLPIDVSVIDSPLGMVIAFANYQGEQYQNITIEVPFVRFQSIAAVRAGPLQSSTKSGADGRPALLSITLPKLDWADMIVFRK